MKKYLVYILAALCAITALSSCGDDFLKEEPKMAQSNEITLSNIDNINSAVAGLYSPLAYYTWYGENFILYNEMRTMNGRKYMSSSHDSGRYNDAYAINFTPNSTSYLWGTAYYVIQSANQILANIDEVEGEEATKNNLKAECLFMRALSHFDLVRMYAQPYSHTSDASHVGVPVLTTVQTITDQPARNTVAEVYAQVVEDLTTAENLMDADYARTGGNDPKAYATQAAIQALLCRVYLYMERWDDVVTYANKVISNTSYSLWTADECRDAACFTQDVPSGGEIIFEMYGLSSNEYDGYWDSLQCLTAPDGNYGDCGASPELLESYDSSDVRRTWLSPDEDGNYLFTMKYAGKGLGTPDVNNTIILRLSEVYLNRAEAYIELGNTSAAAADLQTIATNRQSVAESSTLTGVYAERNKELCWEGHLWFDLGRTGRAMTRETYGVAGIPSTVAADDYRWALPIPQREFTVNKNLVQNEGYGE